MADWNLLKLFSGKAGARASGDQPFVSIKKLPPDPRIVQAIGRNHNFESAVADIVDNSIDAGANNILIRFIRNNGELIGLYIVDDGRGMNGADIDRAMTYGAKREYGESDLGHFGVGLKAASLGQAQKLTVVSRKAKSTAVGRRLVREKVVASFECEVLSDADAAWVLDRPWGAVTPTTGTAVLWSEVKSFPNIVREADELLGELTNRLCRRLGLIFHRLIEAGKTKIVIDQEDIGLDDIGAQTQVRPVDPFAYQRSGRTDYPRTLRAGDLSLECHVWPGRSNAANFKLDGSKATDFQGLYIYRNDRLLHVGGWNGLVLKRDDLQLARVAVNMPAGANALFEMNAEKTQVEPSKLFKQLAAEARDGGVNLQAYLDHATDTYKLSRKPNKERPPVLRVGQGFAPDVKDAVADEFEFVTTHEPVNARWEALDEDVFFDLDHKKKAIRLNRNYRTLITGGRNSLNDAPLIKALLYLLVEKTLHGQVLGSRDKDNIAVWQAILTAAADAEAEAEKK